ncbi:hypothetical protein ACFOYW_08930 [Gryllotalpicola reticulitermitis]|uniref:Uncharacterized protein n=1 Tax=Gryllotalpicola reticulitermitis TaxID=1184153 RepID=A0ABV8Q661_9MICO
MHTLRHTLLSPFGHLASYRELTRHVLGADTSAAPFRISSPSAVIRHPRSDVYVCAHLDDDALTAARVGALLDCVTVLARHGLPVSAAVQRRADGTFDEPAAAAGVAGVHLRFRPGDGRASARRWAEPQGVRAHWARRRYPVVTLEDARHAFRRGSPISRLELPLEEALAQALGTCLTSSESIAVFEALLARAATAHARAIASRSVLNTSTTVTSRAGDAPSPFLRSGRSAAAVPDKLAGLTAPQLAAVLTRVSARVRARLVRAGLPPEVGDALRRLS